MKLGRKELQAQLDILRDVQLDFKNKYGQGHQLLVGRMIDIDIKLEKANQ